MPFLRYFFAALFLNLTDHLPYTTVGAFSSQRSDRESQSQYVAGAQSQNVAVPAKLPEADERRLCFVSYLPSPA